MSAKKIIVFIAGLVAIAIVWAVDYQIIDAEVTFTTLYLLPILFVTWFSTTLFGYMCAVLSVAAWYSVYAKMPFFSVSLLSCLNLFTKSLIFFSFVFLISTLKKALEREKKLAGIDFLTNIDNARSFYDSLSIELERTTRYKKLREKFHKLLQRIVAKYDACVKTQILLAANAAK
jgi:K+-sensing histidine kinase KdpD